jgi:hypothetical protein
MVFPRDDLDALLKKTWLPDSVLCSAREEGGKVLRETEAERARRYLLPQLRLFPRAAVIALGGKARRRLEAAGYRAVAHAFPAAPPGCNYRKARPSWEAAAAWARERIQRDGRPL